MKEKISIPEEEIETTWNYSKVGIGPWAEMYTTDKSMMKRYEKFALKYPDRCKILKDDQYSMTFSIDPKCFGFYPRAPRIVNMTDERKQELAERMRKARESKTTQN